MAVAVLPRFGVVVGAFLDLLPRRRLGTVGHPLGHGEGRYDSGPDLANAIDNPREHVWILGQCFVIVPYKVENCSPANR